MSQRGLPITRQIRERRQKQAQDRFDEYALLTLNQKIERLPPEPGAKKQRTRLLALLEAQKANKG
jgi:hypothetical protein